MRHLLMMLPLLFAATGAEADMASYSAKMPRYDISNMTCDEVHAALQSSGKAVLWWHNKAGLPRYAKYIDPGQACKMEQYKTRTAVGTTDAKSPHACRVIQCSNYGRPPAR
jgi:hypothetical protein